MKNQENVKGYGEKLSKFIKDTLYQTFCFAAGAFLAPLHFTQLLLFMGGYKIFTTSYEYLENLTYDNVIQITESYDIFKTSFAEVISSQDEKTEEYIDKINKELDETICDR